MQDRIVCAFRMRLKRHHYEDVSIKRLKSDSGNMPERYLVSVVEPLFGSKLLGELTVVNMYNRRLF